MTAVAGRTGGVVNKYGQKLLIKPTRQAVRSVLEKARQRSKSCQGHNAAVLIEELNPLLRGWANYHQHVVSKKVFSRLDYYVHGMLWRWARREHRDKSDGWIRPRFLSADAPGAFAIRTRDRKGKECVRRVYRLAQTPIEYHLKVQGAANPYDPNYEEYFQKRRFYAWRTYPLGNPRVWVPSGKDNLSFSHGTPLTPDGRITSTEVGLCRGSSRMKGHSHVRFLGGLERATAQAYTIPSLEALDHAELSSLVTSSRDIK